MTTIIEKPKLGSTLLLYLFVSDETISVGVVQEQQQLIYFTDRPLQGAEIRYQVIKKVALAFLYAARRLRPYFQSDRIIVKIDYLIGKVLQKHKLASHMIAWSVELSEYWLQFEPSGPIKVECLADFSCELQNTPIPHQDEWTMFVDDALNVKGSDAEVVLESPHGVRIEQSLHFNFKTSNNQVEYEALMARLCLA